MAEQLSIEQRIEQAMTSPEETPQKDNQLSLLNSEQEQPIAEEVVESNVEETTEPEVVEPDDVEAIPEAAEQKNEETEIPLNSLNELAEHIGVDAADLYKLRVPITDINTGERQEVSLGEWKDSYISQQRSSRAEQEARELKETLEADRLRFNQEVERQAQEGAAIINQVEQQLMSEYQNIPWDNLKVTDPTQWAIKKQEFNERQVAVQQVRQKAANDYQQRVNEAQQAQAQQMQEIAQRELESLMRALPQWRDNEKRSTEQGLMREYLLNSGYTAQELEQAYDHRTIVLAHKAMQFDAMQKKGRTAKNRVAKIGNKKVLRPGAKQSKRQVKQDAEAQLRARLKKTGDHRDAAALISQRLNRG